MEKWSLADAPVLEKPNQENVIVDWQLTDVLFNSTNCRCRVESINPTTGEYRITLQGTLDLDKLNKQKK